METQTLNKQMMDQELTKAMQEILAAAYAEHQGLGLREINIAKNLFVYIANQECPGFQIREAYKPALHDIVLWCLGQQGRLDTSKGLWLEGQIGTGKSTLMKILSRYWRIVTGASHYFRVSNVVDVCGAYENEGIEALQSFLDWRVQCFDELGRESIPAYHYGSCQNVMEYLLHRRYDRRDRNLTFVTTNLTRRQIAEFYGEHIADRCRQMFNFITLMGDSFRK